MLMQRKSLPLILVALISFVFAITTGALQFLITSLLSYYDKLRPTDNCSVLDMISL